MSVLLDTNILTALHQQHHPRHGLASAAVSELKNRNQQLCIAPQNVYEFWSVATRPIGASNGLGLTTQEASLGVARICSLFTLLPENHAIYHQWLQLVTAHDVKGKTSHDARLVAAMQVHGIARILTFNDADFARFSAISALHPSAVTTAP